MSRQQFTVFDANLSIKIPSTLSISDDEAAVLPSNLTASAVALFDPETLTISAT